MIKTTAHNAACLAFHRGGVKAAVTVLILEASFVGKRSRTEVDSQLEPINFLPLVHFSVSNSVNLDFHCCLLCLVSHLSVFFLGFFGLFVLVIRLRQHLGQTLGDPVHDPGAGGTAQTL